MRINRVFFNSFMGYGFQGLTEIAKDSKTAITPESCLCFINRKQTSFKLLIGGQYLAYYRGDKKIPLDAIQYLPTSFGGTKMEFDQAVKTSLNKKLGFTL